MCIDSSIFNGSAPDVNSTFYEKKLETNFHLKIQYLLSIILIGIVACKFQ